MIYYHNIIWFKS